MLAAKIVNKKHQTNWCGNWSSQINCNRRRLRRRGRRHRHSLRTGTSAGTSSIFGSRSTGSTSSTFLVQSMPKRQALSHYPPNTPPVGSIIRQPTTVPDWNQGGKLKYPSESQLSFFEKVPTANWSMAEMQDFLAYWKDRIVRADESEQRILDAKDVLMVHQYLVKRVYEIVNLPRSRKGEQGWKFLDSDPSECIACAVWSDGSKKSQTSEYKGSPCENESWWPCIVLTDISKDNLVPFLCPPLALVSGRPWPAHISRLQVLDLTRMRDDYQYSAMCPRHFLAGQAVGPHKFANQIEDGCCQHDEGPPPQESLASIDASQTGYQPLRLPTEGEVLVLVIQKTPSPPNCFLTMDRDVAPVFHTCASRRCNRPCECSLGSGSGVNGVNLDQYYQHRYQHTTEASDLVLGYKCENCIPACRQSHDSYPTPSAKAARLGRKSWGVAALNWFAEAISRLCPRQQH